MTDRQNQIRIYMAEYHAQQGCWPTMQEIGDRFGVSRPTVWEHLTCLHRRGITYRINAHSTARSWAVRREHMPEAENIIIPVRGRIRAENMR